MVVADYAQPWKRFQSEFRSLERQKLAEEADAERKKLSGTDLAQLNKDVAAAEAALAGHRDEIKKLEGEVSKRQADLYVADSSWKGSKAKLDAARFEYDAAVQAKENEKEKAQARDERAKELQDRKNAVDKADEALAAAQQKLADRKAALTEAEKKLADLQKGVDSLQTRIAALDKNAAYFVLNAPLMDFVQPTLHVEQAVAPRPDAQLQLHRRQPRRPLHDLSRGGQPARLRRPGVERSRSARTRSLDTYVGDGSAAPLHAVTAARVCHGGLDRATDFTRAGHSPKDAKQREEWEKKWGWTEPQFLEYPILPSGMSEAGCATCHSAGVWTAKAEVQDTGRELITHMGCNGCHTINFPAYTGLRKAGPSLKRIAGKTNPGWAYKWIEAPRNFHPTTFMPHFFYQSNTKTPVNLKRQQTEIAAIVNYLWDKSEKPVYPPAPAGERGERPAALRDGGLRRLPHHRRQGEARRLLPDDQPPARPEPDLDRQQGRQGVALRLGEEPEAVLPRLQHAEPAADRPGSGGRHGVHLEQPQPAV